MTDRELLLSMKSILDAHLGIAPTAAPTAPPPGSPLSNAIASESLGGTILAGYAGSNPGPATQPIAEPVGPDVHRLPSFDYAVPSSYRTLEASPGGTATVFLPVPIGKAGLIVLHVARSTGNEADFCRLHAEDRNTGRILADFQGVSLENGQPEIMVNGGEYIAITVSAGDRRLVCSIRFEPK